MSEKTTSSNNCCQFLSDGIQAVSGSEDGCIHFWDLRKGGNPYQIIKKSSAPITQLACSDTCPQYLWIANQEGNIWLFNQNSKSFEVQLTGSNNDPIYGLQVHSNHEIQEVYGGARDGFMRKYVIPSNMNNL